MRAPRIKVRTQQQQRKPKPIDSDCLLCTGKICQKGPNPYQQAKIITRSITKWKNEFKEIIIYETYRCMPLLGDEKMHAPDWEEHIAYHQQYIVFEY